MKVGRGDDFVVSIVYGYYSTFLSFYIHILLIFALFLTQSKVKTKYVLRLFKLIFFPHWRVTVFICLSFYCTHTCQRQRYPGLPGSCNSDYPIQREGLWICRDLVTKQLPCIVQGDPKGNQMLYIEEKERWSHQLLQAAVKQRKQRMTGTMIYKTKQKLKEPLSGQSPHSFARKCGPAGTVITAFHCERINFCCFNRACL